jgi:hypothetical protein
MQDPSQFHISTSKLYDTRLNACVKLESLKRSIAQNGQLQHSLFQKKMEKDGLYPTLGSLINV